MQKTKKTQVAGGVNSVTTTAAAPSTSRRSTAGQPHISSTAEPYTRAGESGAPPQLSPHLCDESVDLVLSEEDRAIVLGEVNRLEAYSLVVQVQGSRMNRSELRHTLYAAFSEEADNILDIQFMSRGCYHVEFATEESVNKLLAIKEAGVEGAWVSFHKWFHNVKVDDILQDQEASMVFTTIFPGLRKEWRNVLPRIGALLGKVIATRDGQAHGSDRMGGVPAVRLIAPRSVRLPATISLPNLLLNKPPVVQKVYYQGLPDQCFVCRQFGHLGRDCQKRRTYNEAPTPNRPNVNYDGWSTISNKHVFKPSNTMVNPMLLLEANPYQALQEVEKDAGITAMEVGLAFPNLTKEDRVEQNAQDILLKVQTVESVSKVNNQWNNDKHMLLDKLKQDDRSLLVNKGGKMEVGKVDLPHVDMDCGNIIAFTTATTFSDRVSIVDKHVPVRAHKLSGKDIWSNRRQLRASEDGRKGRDVALTEKRAGGKNINDG